MSQIVEITSDSPFREMYPGRNLVTSETLGIMKILRQNGYTVHVGPYKHKTPEYLFRKGLNDLFSDPIFLLAVGIPASIIATLIANYIQKLIDKGKRDVSVNALQNVYVSTFQSNATIDLLSNVISKGHKLDLEEKRRIAAKKFQVCLEKKSPYPNLPTPLFYEHKPQIVGWGRVFLDEIGIKTEDSHIEDKNVFRKIKNGKIKGGSLTGIAEISQCSICRKNYVECEHIAGEIYGDHECYNSIQQATPIEFSLVKTPVNTEAIVTIANKLR